MLVVHFAHALFSLACSWKHVSLWSNLLFRLFTLTGIYMCIRCFFFDWVSRPACWHFVNWTGSNVYRPSKCAVRQYTGSRLSRERMADKLFVKLFINTIQIQEFGPVEVQQYKTPGLWEQDAEESVWTQAGWNNKRLRGKYIMGSVIIWTPRLTVPE
jgi:hypothetical protein